MNSLTFFQVVFLQTVLSWCYLFDIIYFYELLICEHSDYLPELGKEHYRLMYS